MRRFVLGSALLLAGLCLALAGCSHGGSVTVGNREPARHAHPGRGHGPPPHAPAHGYRAKQHHVVGDVELVFDSDLGVYLVVGMPNHFYWDGIYLRVEKGSWYASARLDSGWKPRKASSLPPGLRKQAARGKGKKHKGPAKGAW